MIKHMIKPKLKHKGQGSKEKPTMIKHKANDKAYDKAKA